MNNSRSSEVLVRCRRPGRTCTPSFDRGFGLSGALQYGAMSATGHRSDHTNLECFT